MTDPFRLLYTGSRSLDADAHGPAIYRQMDALLGKYGAVLLRHGHCRDGGDAIVDRWAEERIADGCAVTVDRRPAPWQLLGKIAGPMRNGFMAGLGADGCLAHIRGGSRGASGCADFAEWAGIPTKRVVA